MINYDLPTQLDVNGKLYDIRTDYRVALDIMVMFEDVNLTLEEKATALIEMLYVDWKEIEDYNEAYEKAIWYIDMGQEFETSSKKPLMSWEQDFELYVGEVNKSLGYDCRVPKEVKPTHWWSFLTAFMGIGESTFATVTSIRDKKNKGKKLEKWEKEFEREHLKMVTLKRKHTEEEEEFIKSIFGG